MKKKRGAREQARDYCKKPDTRTAIPVEFGIWRATSETTGLSRIVAGLKEGKALVSVADEEAETYIRNYRGIAQWHALTCTQPKQTEDVRGIWLYGDPGIGKTHKARKIGGDSIFLKAQNKWWDGYSGESVVVLDDLDKQGSCLGHYLKIWSDKWPCTGEIKGGVVKLQHDKFVVTSNYLPSDLWPDDQVLCEAVERRFVFKKGVRSGNVVKWEIME